MKNLLEKYESVLPKLFLGLYNDFKSDYVGEYEFIQNPVEDIKAITRNDSLENDFFLFLRNPVGSLYGFWIIHENDFSNNPIVQFSCDGEFGVIASNFNSFLSQLYLLGADSLQLSKYLSKVDLMRFRGDESVLTKTIVQEKYRRIILSEEEIIEHVDMVKKEFEGQNLLNWLKKNEIPEIKTEELFGLVVDTYLKSPNLVEFLKSKESL